jgi:hypothetical protein
MEDFILFIEEKTKLISSIKDKAKNLTFLKGENVFFEAFPNIVFRICNISFPMNGPDIILLENSKTKSRFFINPSKLIKIK